MWFGWIFWWRLCYSLWHCIYGTWVWPTWSQFQFLQGSFLSWNQFCYSSLLCEFRISNFGSFLWLMLQFLSTIGISLTFVWLCWIIHVLCHNHWWPWKFCCVENFPMVTFLTQKWLIVPGRMRSRVGQNWVARRRREPRQWQPAIKPANLFPELPLNKAHVKFSHPPSLVYCCLCRCYTSMFSWELGVFLNRPLVRVEIVGLEFPVKWVFWLPCGARAPAWCKKGRVQPLGLFFGFAEAVGSAAVLLRLPSPWEPRE